MLWRIAVWLEQPLRIARRFGLRALGTITRPLRWLPGSSASFGPPRHFTLDSRAWASSQATAAVWPVSAPRRVIHTLPPIHADLVPARFRAGQSGEIPATYVVGIPHGRIWGPEGIVITSDDTVLADMANRFVDRPVEFPVFWRPYLGRPTRISGRAATLAGMYSASYYHWMLDLFPRLHVLRQAGIQPDVYVINAPTSFQRDCLDAAGVPADKRIVCTRTTHVEFDQLLAPSPAGATGHSPAGACDFVRDCFAENLHRGQPFRRLYVSRRDAARRRVVDEPALIEALRPFGFEEVTLDGRSVAEQARLFSEAAAVVAPHGAALTNLVFCQPGTLAVELFDARYTPVCYWTLSDTRGLLYRPLFSEPAPGAPRSAQWADIRIDLAQLKELLATCAIR